MLALDPSEWTVVDHPSENRIVMSFPGGEAFAVRTRRDIPPHSLRPWRHDAGQPGLRCEYDAHYFGAFVFDPDGNKIEAVTRSSQ